MNEGPKGGRSACLDPYRFRLIGMTMLKKMAGFTVPKIWHEGCLIAPQQSATQEDSHES